ncbi:unnamed protein product, partial [Ectocarpus sp. 12 AP-2014]
KEYDQITALHYAAYRSSLHANILKTYLTTTPKSNYGLDIGCGTGQSAIALSKFCNTVIGVDPSKQMIKKSIKHTGVSYELMETKVLNFDKDTFDIITFAGSLFYAKSQELLDECIRVSKANSLIIAYDFEFHLTDILKLLGVGTETNVTSAYDHEINFFGLHTTNVHLNSQYKQSIHFDITLADLAHVLLSSKNDYI